MGVFSPQNPQSVPSLWAYANYSLKGSEGLSKQVQGGIAGCYLAERGYIQKPLHLHINTTPRHHIFEKPIRFCLEKVPLARWTPLSPDVPQLCCSHVGPFLYACVGMVWRMCCNSVEFRAWVWETCLEHFGGINRKPEASSIQPYTLQKLRPTMLSVLLALGLDYALFMLTRFEENRCLQHPARKGKSSYNLHPRH